MQATVGIPFAKILSSTLFTDPEKQNLTIACNQVGGATLPTWLKFESYTKILYGTPSSYDIGSINLEFKATDPYGLTTSNLTATLEIKTNNSPLVRFGQILPTITIKN